MKRIVNFIVLLLILLTVFFLILFCGFSMKVDDRRIYSRNMQDYLKCNKLDADNVTSLGQTHFNHTTLDVLNVEINKDLSPSGAVWLPRKWQPGLKVTVDWDVDPSPGALKLKDVMNYDEFQIYKKAYQDHISKYLHHQVIVTVPPYVSDDLCQIAAHILPENKVGLAVSCSGYGIENWRL